MLLAICLAGSPLVPADAWAQTTVVLPIAPETKGVTKPAAEEPSIGIESETALQAHLAEAEAELATMARAESPPGISEQEIVQRRVALTELITVYRILLTRLQDVADLDASRDSLAQERSGLHQLPEAETYSFLAVDQLRETERSIQDALDTLDTSSAVTQREYDNNTELLNRLNALLRQAAERLETNRTPGAVPSLLWRRDLAELHSRVQGLLVTSLLLEQRLTDDKKAINRQRLEQVQTELARTTGKVAYSAEDLRQVKENLEHERQVLSEELRRATNATEAARADLRRADAALKTAASANGTTAAVDLTALRRAVELSRAKTEILSQRMRLLSAHLQRLNREAIVWEKRWALGRHPDTTLLEEATAEVKKERSEIALLGEFVDQRYAQYRDLLIEREGRAKQARSTDEAEHESAMAELFRQRLLLFGEFQQQIATYGHLVDRWAQDVEAARGGMAMGERLEARLLDLWKLTLHLWDYEVFTLEDQIEVDGRTVTGKRGVTVGKFVSAILILALGYWLSRWLSRRFEHAAVARLWLHESHARIARRWIDAVGLVILALIALTWVRIPLTAFAFLGGAVAIGVGFGMQTLFKNLISGLMILIEQPFHLGDLVEVGAIRGRVTDIGVRASVVRDTQGIETLIPNSSFLEQSVTNWTYNNMRVRFSVQVGVAYDADLRRVRELLEQVGGRHNLLIQEPPPFVLLDDFGPDALLVSLNFWLELRPEVDRLAVQSDLRFMIVQTFAKAGIAIAFPQRDVHLDTSHPLEIQMMAPAGRSGPASGGASAPDMS